MRLTIANLLGEIALLLVRTLLSRRTISPRTLEKIKRIKSEILASQD